MQNALEDMLHKLASIKEKPEKKVQILLYPNALQKSCLKKI
jgi:hypothetical protein